MGEAGLQRSRPGYERGVVASEELMNGGHAGGGDAGEHLNLALHDQLFDGNTGGGQEAYAQRRT